MLIKTFLDLPEDKPDKIAVGELFLEGGRTKHQKDVKKVGDQIVYYKVIKVHNDGKRYEYTQVFDILEEEK